MSYLSTPTARKRIVAEELLENEIQWVQHYNLMPEGQQTGLAADSTGVKYTSVFYLLVNPQMVRHAKEAYVEYAVSTLASGAELTLHIYDIEASNDLATFTGIDAAVERGLDWIPVEDLEQAIGHELNVKWEVATAAASGTFDVAGVRLVIIKGVS